MAAAAAGSLWGFYGPLGWAFGGFLLALALWQLDDVGRLVFAHASAVAVGFVLAIAVTLVLGVGAAGASMGACVGVAHALALRRGVVHWTLVGAVVGAATASALFASLNDTFGTRALVGGIAGGLYGLGSAWLLTRGDAPVRP